jgi:dihydroflavonol-4-reductase
MLSQKSKIFVTGATGFLGSYIVRQLLVDGYDNIICLTRHYGPAELTSDFYDKVRWVTGDILDVPFLSDQLPGVDCIIHAAAIVTFSTRDKKKMIQTASDGTANLVNIAMDTGVQKFVHISSIAAIGRRKQEEDISEKMMFSHSKYDTTYGLSKFLAEQEVWRAHAEGLHVTILNPSMILGAGKWSSSSIQIFSKLKKGISYYPSGTNGWVDVRDVAKAAVMSVSEQHDGERFIISAENLPYQSIMQDIATELKVKGPEKKVNLNLAGIVWRLEAIRSYITGKNPVITKETIQSTSVTARYDNTKSKDVLGLSYRPIKNCIQESCQVFMATESKGFGIF